VPNLNFGSSLSGTRHPSASFLSSVGDFLYHPMSSIRQFPLTLPSQSGEDLEEEGTGQMDSLNLHRRSQSNF
jgi:hypothetical protein